MDMPVSKKRKHMSGTDRAFSLVNYTLFGLLTIICVCSLSII